DGIRDFHVTGVQTCALPIYVFPGRLPQLQVQAAAGPRKAQRKAGERPDGRVVRVEKPVVRHAPRLPERRANPRAGRLILRHEFHPLMAPAVMPSMMRSLSSKYATNSGMKLSISVAPMPPQ